MMRLQATGVTTPTVPQTQPVATQPAPVRPSFKGEEGNLHGDLFDGQDVETNSSKFDNLMDENTLNDYKAQFEGLRDDEKNPSIVKKFGEFGILVITGLLSYGTAKYGMNKCAEMVSNMAKSKPIKDAAAGVTEFASGKVIPFLKEALETIESSKATGAVKDAAGGVAEKVSGKAGAAVSAVKATKIGKFFSEKIAPKFNIVPDGKVDKAVNFVLNKLVDLKNFVKGVFTKVKLPTGEQLKKGGIETVAISSGVTGGISGTQAMKDAKAEMENKRESEGE